MYALSSTAKKCRNDTVCMQRWSTHTGQCTKATPTCINCKGAYAANDKREPSFLQKVQLKKFKSQNHLTIQEVRRQFQAQQKSVVAHYATVAARPPAEKSSRSEFETVITQLFAKFKNTVETVFVKCRPQFIRSLDPSPCLWWLWSWKSTEIKFINSYWLIFR